MQRSKTMNGILDTNIVWDSLGRFVYDLSVHYRGKNSCIGDLHRIDRKDIVGNNYDVGKLARLERAFYVFLEFGVG